MRVQLPDPIAQETIAEIIAARGNTDLSSKLDEFAFRDANLTKQHIQLIADATISVARALLMAKCVLPQDEIKLTAAFQKDLAQLRPHAVLIELGLAMIEAEKATTDDLFRDKNLISDELFAKRIRQISQCLVQ